MFKPSNKTLTLVLEKNAICKKYRPLKNVFQNKYFLVTKTSEDYFTRKDYFRRVLTISRKDFVQNLVRSKTRKAFKTFIVYITDLIKN